MSLFFILVLNQTVPCPWPLMCPAHWSLELELGSSTHCPAVACSAEHPSGIAERGQSQAARVFGAHLAGALSTGDDLWEGIKPGAHMPFCVSSMSGMTHI